MQTRPDLNHDRLVPYLCRFQLFVQDLEAQMYFPSSFKVAWRTKDNDELASTNGFVAKNQLHVARFEEALQAQTMMLYNKQTKKYVDKDTFIVVSYYLNSKPNEVKELGKITLEMSSFMEEKGDETVRKGEPGLGSHREEKVERVGTIGSQKRNGFKPKQVDSMKCLRLQGSQYLSKLKFKCSLVQSTVSKLTLSSITVEEFNQPLDEYMKTTKKPLMNKSPQPKSVGVSIKTKQQLPKVVGRQSKQKPLTIPHFTQSQTPSAHLQNNSQASTSQQQQLKQSIHTQNTKQSTLQQSLMIPSSINEPSKNQHQDKIIAQLQHIQKENIRLMGLCENQKSFIIEQQKTIKLLKQSCYDLEDQLKEKELYLQNNLDKLQALDHYKYEMIQLKDYIAKLEERLTIIYQQKSTTLQNLWKTVTGYRQSLISKPPGSNLKKNPSLVQSSIKINSISLIDSNQDQKKGLSQSVNFIRPMTMRDSRQKQTHKSIPEHLFMVSSSEIQLTNSEMRQIEGSTVRMQKQLSFMQTELYEVKGNVILQQQRYEEECKMHSDTKLELFALQERMKGLEKELKELKGINNDRQVILQQLNQLHEDNQCLHRQIDKLQQVQLYQKQQNFKLRQSKQDQEYQLSVVIKQQKLQLESVKEQLNKQSVHMKQLQDLLNAEREKLKEQAQDGIKMKSQLSSVIKENFRLGKQVQLLKSKQSEIGSYLSGLQSEFNQVQKIVEDKEDNEEHLHQLILQKQQIIDKKQTDIEELSRRIKNFQLLVQTLEKQLALQRLKSQHESQSSSLNASKSHQQISKQSNLKLTLLQTSNNELIKKNKQLIGIVAKNAAALVAYEKQKKEFLVLNNLAKQLQTLKKLKQQIQAQNNKLTKDNEKLVNQFRQIEKKHFEEGKKANIDKQTLKETLNKLQRTNQYQSQQILKLKQQISLKQYLLSQNQLKLSELQGKITKFTKQKKISQQSVKFLQSKTKTYQSLILQHQSNLTSKQSMIKSLQSKLRFYETQHQNNSLKTSSYGHGIDEGLSEIKLESEIYDSRKIYEANDSSRVYHGKNYFSASNSKNNKLAVSKQYQKDNSYKKEQSRHEQAHNQSSYLISPLSQNQDDKLKRHEAFKGIVGNVEVESHIGDYSMKKKGDSSNGNSKEKITVLINMIQSYIQVKKQNSHKLQIQAVIDKRNKNESNQSEVSSQILKKIHESLNQLNKYKTKLIKDNKTKSKSSVDLIIQPLKPIEKAINSLLNITMKIN